MELTKSRVVNALSILTLFAGLSTPVVSFAGGFHGKSKVVVKERFKVKGRVRCAGPCGPRRRCFAVSRCRVNFGCGGCARGC